MKFDNDECGMDVIIDMAVFFAGVIGTSILAYIILRWKEKNENR
jgi:hypothetical protein